jgi:hypothetical protein
MSVFRKPRAVRALVKETIDEAVRIGERQAGQATGDAIEEGAIRLTQQATGTPAKLRLVIERQTGSALGTKGEDVLQIGLTAVGVEMFTTRTAGAAEAVRESVAREEAHRAAADTASEDDGSCVEWLPVIGDLCGGSLNAGEGSMLGADREQQARAQIIQQALADLVHAVEEDMQRSLGRDEIAELRDEILTIVTSGADLEAADASAPAGEAP